MKEADMEKSQNATKEEIRKYIADKYSTLTADQQRKFDKWLELHQ